MEGGLLRLLPVRHHAGHQQDHGRYTLHTEEDFLDPPSDLRNGTVHYSGFSCGDYVLELPYHCQCENQLQHKCALSCNNYL